MMINYLKKLKSLDYFGQPFQLTFDNQSYFYSWLGFSLTILIIGLAIAITITTGNQLFKKVKPNINTSIINGYMAENYTLSSHQIPFSYSLQGGDVNKFMNPSYYNIEVIHYSNVKYTQTNGTPVEINSREQIPYELCGNNREKYIERFNKFGNFTEVLDLNKFDSHICLKNDNYTIGGNYLSNFFSNVLFQVHKCVNSTKNNFGCKTPSEINAVTASVNFGIYYIHSIPKPTNYTHPFQNVLDNYWMKVDPNIFQHADLYFSRLNITTDAGFMFEEFQTESRWQFEKFREIYQVTPPPNRVLRIYFGTSQNRVEITRFYMKVQELIALVGGILKATIVVGFGLTKFFHMYLMDELLINTFFDYKLTDKVDSRNVKPMYSNKTLKLVNLNSEKMNKIDPNLQKRSMDKRFSVTRGRDNPYMKYNTGMLSNTGIDEFKTISNIKYLDNGHSNYNSNCYIADQKSGKELQRFSERTQQTEVKLLQTKKTIDQSAKNDFGIRTVEGKKQYHLDYWNIVNMVFCPCKPESKIRSTTHQIFKDKLNEYTDYSEVINEIISYRYFKEFVICNDIDLGFQENNKVKIDFNPYLTKENPALKTFIQSLTELYKEKLINEKLLKKVMKIIRKERD